MWSSLSICGKDKNTIHYIPLCIVCLKLYLCVCVCSCVLSPVVSKASSGAMEMMTVFSLANMPDFLSVSVHHISYFKY